jgi:osmotically-inducible protein OsmY
MGERDGWSLDDPIKIHVQHGWVIVKGTVHSKFWRAKLEEVVRKVTGVRGLSNRLKIKEVATQRRPRNKREETITENHSPQLLAL